MEIKLRERISMGPKKISFNIENFRKFVRSTMKKWGVPGVAVAIVKDGKGIFLEGFGWRNVKKKLKVSSHTLFPIASCTKAFTTTSMGILVDEGKLDWDKPVREYVASFKMYDSVQTERMTPRDLVTHRSGLPRYDWVWYRADYLREEIIERLRHLKPNKDLRYIYQYQNIMYTMAGYLVGHIAKCSWEEFVQKRIFDPLEMKESNFSITEMQKISDYSSGYLKKKNKIIELPFVNINALGPAGSINSNVVDMAKWLLLNLNNGKSKNKRIISEKSLKEIHSPHIVVPEEVGYGEIVNPCYGLGWGVISYRGKKLLQHGGNIDGFQSYTSLMSSEKIGICVLTNLDGSPAPRTIAYYAYDCLLRLEAIDWNKRAKFEIEKDKKEQMKERRKSALERKKGTKLSHPINDYIGEFENPAYGKVLIEKKKDKLYLVFHKISYLLKHYHYDMFEFTDPLSDTRRKVSFQISSKGDIKSLSVDFEPAAEPIVFELREKKK